MVRQFVDNIGITSDGADVKLALAISNAKLLTLLSMMDKKGGSGGGFGGMGGM